MKKSILVVILAILFAVAPLKNTYFIFTEKTAQNKDEIDGQNYLQSVSQYDVKKAEKNVKKAKAEREYISFSSPTSAEVNAVLKKLKEGKTTYKKVMNNVYIVGDSLMNGLEAYNILNSNRLITQVSASLYHLSDNVNRIIKLSPPVLILHYGVNMIDTSKTQLNTFISMYTKLINKIKKGSPDTRIIVSGIFPVDTEVAKAKRFKMIPSYNKALLNMCKTLKIEYLDSTKVLNAHKECYGGDGIHLSKAFYEKYWLKYIIKEMEIVG